ncbi:MAG: Uma2 family endonuclease [Isosphaeraceae bacterium]
MTMTAKPTPPVHPSATEPRVVLHGIGWDTYEKLLDDLGGSRVRLTYDRGTLEIMSPSFEHDDIAEAFTLLINYMATELGIRYLPKGSTTFRKKAKQRGLEPDRCYYFDNRQAIAFKKRYEPEIDPPPDLVVEIEATNPVTIDRMAIYADLGVPEVWRFDRERLTVWGLADGRYEARERSPIFPMIPPEGLVPFLLRSRGEATLDWAPDFLAWVRGCLQA